MGLKWEPRERKEEKMEQKMEQKFELTAQEIGDAIVNYIAMTQGKRFFPFRIKSTSLKLPDKVYFELEFVPKGTKAGDYPHIFEE